MITWTGKGKHNKKQVGLSWVARYTIRRNRRSWNATIRFYDTRPNAMIKSDTSRQDCLLACEVYDALIGKEPA